MNDEPLRLLADGMLGKLAKWLRLMGYDTAYDNVASDPELARRARAEGRVLLTRDRELSTRRGLRTLLIQSEVLEEQVREVQDGLGPSPHSPLSRCAVCNTALETASPTEIADRVPPYVLRTQTEFRRCPGCERVYWPGSHFQGMRDRIERFAPKEPSDA
ncbi:MAG: Mut7-C RNAse domain-containing protein [Anaerolineae bacterium]